MMFHDFPPVRQLILFVSPGHFAIEEPNLNGNLQTSLVKVASKEANVRKEEFYFSSADGQLTFNSAFFAFVAGELERSWEFRKLFCGPKPSSNLLVLLVSPSKQFIDFSGNSIVNWFMRERQGLEYALSWMSTLGGAFSSLGDASDSFAEKAGRTSWRQLIVAERLGDGELAVRCRLYAALSLLQRGYLKDAKNILRREYKAAVQQHKDVRLKRMCLGIWAKCKFAALNLPHNERKTLFPKTSYEINVKSN